MRIKLGPAKRDNFLRRAVMPKADPPKADRSIGRPAYGGKSVRLIRRTPIPLRRGTSLELGATSRLSAIKRIRLLAEISLALNKAAKGGNSFPREGRHVAVRSFPEMLRTRPVTPQNRRVIPPQTRDRYACPPITLSAIRRIVPSADPPTVGNSSALNLARGPQDAFFMQSIDYILFLALANGM